MIHLGVDLGERRIGVAVSDPDGRVAVPSGIAERRGSQTLAELLEPWLREYEIGVVVVGIPVRTDGSEGPEAIKAREEVADLRKRLALPVKTFDERFTSRMVHAAGARAGVSARKRKGRIDDKAAALMLQGFLDSSRDG
ncbi:MAG: Holliday junction resolvase RuvX [Actinobacteria bacterium ATB1]|nr:Holliday junction resolvase RuvX [Actinobacteria bacterium ATB1]